MLLKDENNERAVSSCLEACAFFEMSIKYGEIKNLSTR